MSDAELISIEVPDIGDFDGVPVIEMHVAPGDTVAVDDPLLTLESDKATMDVPAPVAGVIRELHVKVGDTVAQGTVLMTVEATGTEAATRPSKASAVASDGAPNEAAAPDSISGAMQADEPPSQAPPRPGGSAPTPSEPQGVPVAANGAASNGAAALESTAAYASPAVRRLARELGIDLASVTGSGRKGRITKDDLTTRVDGTGGPDSPGPGAPAGGPGAAIPGLDLAPWPTVDFEKFGPIERVPRSRIQRISARNLARNWLMIPHVTHNDEADITELETWRVQLNDQLGRDGVRITMVSFLVVACVAALKQFPNFNASLDGDELVLKRYYSIGFAADTPRGLVVPVIKDADQKGLREIARDLTELSGKARDGKLSPAEMSGSTFTISSLGGIGGTSFSPIVNAPEVAILGATRSAMKPVWNGHEFEPRLMLPLSLSYDHRVIDGASAARFVVHLGGLLSDLRRALL